MKPSGVKIEPEEVGGATLDSVSEASAAVIRTAVTD